MKIFLKHFLKKCMEECLNTSLEKLPTSLLHIFPQCSNFSWNLRGYFSGDSIRNSYKDSTTIFYGTTSEDSSISFRNSIRNYSVNLVQKFLRRFPPKNPFRISTVDFLQESLLSFAPRILPGICSKNSVKVFL